jgi:hypothetical protein
MKVMTTADWFEYGAQASGNYANFLAIFLTLTSAYLVAAFVVGKKLTRAQLTLIDTVYVAFGSLNIFAQMVTLRNSLFAFKMAANAVEELPRLSDFITSVLPFAVAVLCAVISLGCIKFMWDVRHPKTK